MKNRFSFLCLLAVFAAGTGNSASAVNREAEALAVLSNSAAELKDKARACQTLADFGGAKSIAALSALLADEKLGDYARSGLESMADPGAGAALRRSLGTLRGRQLAGAINSLGVRRDAAAVADLRKLALANNADSAPAAVTALGLIGNADAAQSLQAVLENGPAELRLPAAHASIVAAEQLAKGGNAAAARKLLETSTKAVPSGPSAEAARRAVASLPKR
ncbi:MAG: hypothetical protein RLZZ221_112 [Verrucomicrobiota bacterium]